MESILTLNKDELPESETNFNDSSLGIDISRYYTATKLFRVSALGLRFIRKLQRKKYMVNYPTTEELERAEQMWIKFTQQKNFAEI